MSYRKQSEKQYQARRPPLTIVNTRKWGEVRFPKGSRPIVAKVKVSGQNEPTVIKEGLGYKKALDIDNIRAALELKIKHDLAKDQKAEVELAFPTADKKPVKFSVPGEQPLRPRIIYHQGGGEPPEGILNDIRKEFENPNRKTASDTEVAAYLSTASLVAPLSEEWIRIYMYVTRNYMKSKGLKIDGAMAFLNEYKTLRPDDEREMKRLKEWIFDTQKKDLAEKEKQAKRLAK